MKTNFLIPLLAGLGLLCACKGKNSSYGTDSTTVQLDKRAKAPISQTDSIQSSAKLVKTADIHFKVKSVQQTSERIAALAQSYDGIVVHHLMGSTTAQSMDVRVSNDSLLHLTTYNSTAEMTVKIPSYKMEDFINQAAKMGVYVNDLKMDINDRSLEYLSARLKLKNRSNALSHQGQANQNDMIAYQDNLIDREISNRAINDSVKQSIISLSFYESNVIHKEIIANDNLSAYNLPFFKRLVIAIENGWELFVDLLVALANAWILLPVGVVIWALLKYHKTKKLRFWEKFNGLNEAILAYCLINYSPFFLSANY